MCCSPASSSAATSTPLRRRHRCASRAASACAARPRSPSSRARASPSTSRAATPSRSHSTTQMPGIVRDALAEALDLPGHRLRVVAPDVGGGFGGKGSLYPEEIFVCVAARRLARSVKWTSDRVEDLTATSQAFDEIIDAELGLDRDGAVLALRADAVGDVGAYSIYPWTAALEPVQVVSFLPGPYRIRALSRPGSRGGDLQGADRTLSRRRAADLDLRHGTADGHGGGAASASTPRTSGAQFRSAPRNFPTRPAPASSGTVRLPRMPGRGTRGSTTTPCVASRRRPARPAAGSASASPPMPS